MGVDGWKPDAPGGEVREVAPLINEQALKMEVRSQRWFIFPTSHPWISAAFEAVPLRHRPAESAHLGLPEMGGDVGGVTAKPRPPRFPRAGEVR